MAFSVPVACLNTKNVEKIGSFPTTIQTTFKLFNLDISKDTPPDFSYKCPLCGEQIEFKSIKSHLIEKEEKPKGFLGTMLFGKTTVNPYSYVFKEQRYSFDQLHINSKYHRFTTVLKTDDGKVFSHHPLGLIKDDAGKNVAYCPGDMISNFQSSVIHGQWYDWESGIHLDIGSKYENKVVG